MLVKVLFMTTLIKYPSSNNDSLIIIVIILAAIYTYILTFEKVGTIIVPI